MFGIGHLNILIRKRYLLFTVIATAMVSLLLPACYVKSAIAQEQIEPNEYILEVLLLPNWRISEAIFAYEVNGKYYLPLQELSDGFEFFSEVDAAGKFAQGFASRQENSFTIDGNRNEMIIKGSKQSLNEDAILVSDFVATDDLYVQLEVLTQIWPVELSLELSTLTVFASTEEDLSFMRDRERQDQQKIALSRKEKQKKGKELLPRRENDYQLLGKPVIDYQSSYKFDDDTDELTGTNIFTGLQNIGKLQADFSTNFRFSDSNFQKPDSVRLRFSRQSVGDEYLFIPGIRKIEFGDVTAQQRDLISNSSTGKGVTVSNDNRSRDNEFDQITIEGVGPPGWETELYNNNELIDFGEVPNDGLYFFEDVVLGYGNNEIKILFFGPQGQIKEENRSYTAGGNMLKPGQFRYAANLLDADRAFILLDNEPRSEPRGAVSTLNASYGLNKSLTIFGNHTRMPTQPSNITIDEEQDKNYLTIGGAFSLPVGLFKAEAYSEIRGGNAFNLDYITQFLGFRLNLTTAIFNEFESEKAGFDLSKKKYEIKSQLSKNIKFFSVPIGLRFNALRTKRETDISTTDLDATQTFTRSGLRLSHNIRTRLNEDLHERTSGSLSSTLREGPWQFRGGLNYSLYPETLLSSGTGQVRYKADNSFQTAVNFSHNFETSDYSLGLQAGYDFKRFLGTVESAYDRGKGWNFTLRTTTSLHPYTDNDRYTFSSASKRSSAPVKAYVFLDENADGEMNEGEEPLKGVKIKYGSGRSQNQTDETGYIIADLPTDRLINVQLDTSSITDPYFIPAQKGFSTVPIKGKMIDTVFPVIETGSIEGTVYRKSNKRIVAGLTLDLVNQEGEAIMNVETGFDGFYVFEFVPPGAYTVRTAQSHTARLLGNSASVTPSDLYVYGNELYIDDISIALMEEKFIDIKPSSGTTGDHIFGPPRETFGPQLEILDSSEEMTGTHGSDGLLSGLDKLSAQDARIPAVLPRTGGTGLYALQGVDKNQVKIGDVRLKMHNGKARFVAEFSNHIDYEFIDSNENNTIQLLIRNVTLAEAQAMRVEAYHSEMVQSGNDVLVSISSDKPVQRGMTSLLPSLQGGSSKRLLIDIQ